MASSNYRFWKASELDPGRWFLTTNDSRQISISNELIQDLKGMYGIFAWNEIIEMIKHVSGAHREDTIQIMKEFSDILEKYYEIKTPKHSL